MKDYHTPVLLYEAVSYLLTDANGVYVDGTLGGGGHAEEICKRLGTNGKLICFDADEDAIRFAGERLKDFSPRVRFVQSNFGNITAELQSLGVKSINGLLLDLGVSSYQIDQEEKGFSFRGDERIDMRMDRRQSISGWDVVNSYDEEKLASIIWQYGEERTSRRIARRIVAARPVDSTRQLASTIEEAVGKKFLIKTLARVFQAIRIEVNNELENLERVLADSAELIASGGRMVVISYHSLEDRIVKTFFKDASRTTIPSGNKYVPDTNVAPTFRIMTKSLVEASADEQAQNPRARSAKLRAAERV